MDNNRTVKNVFNTKRIGIWKIGRPKLRWWDDVIQDVKTLGVKNWRNLTMEKESYQKLPRKARARVVLSSQWWWWWIPLSCFYLCNAKIYKWCPQDPVLCQFKTSLPIDSLVDWLWWGETDVSVLRPYGPIVHPRVMCDVDHGMMVPTGANS
jgi:hypothetical protein